MYQKIVLAGGSGFLGKLLAAYYRDRAKEVIVLSRKVIEPDGNIRFVYWDGASQGSWARELEGSDMLVNLCGKNVNCRYTDVNRKAIVSSRVEPTSALGLAIRQLAVPPRLWIQAASATIYRHAEDHLQDEEKGELGVGFSEDVCRAWEDCFESIEVPGTRKVLLRISLVLGKTDGVFPRMRNLVRFGLGGCQGNGRQRMSWVHEIDIARLTEFLLQRADLSGTFNVAAPEVVTNEEFMRSMRRAARQRFGLPSPAWLLGIGARLIGTETELILKSRWIGSDRLRKAGFAFKFPGLDGALKDLFVENQEVKL